MRGSRRRLVEVYGGGGVLFSFGYLRIASFSFFFFFPLLLRDIIWQILSCISNGTAENENGAFTGLIYPR